jgi:hypothetical protein
VIQTMLWKKIRRSITDYVIFYGSQISWRSKGKRNVNISNTEAEYVALDEATTEMKFMYHVLKIMGIDVDLLVRINVDSIGNIFLLLTGLPATEPNMLTQSITL